MPRSRSNRAGRHSRARQLEPLDGTKTMLAGRISCGGAHHGEAARPRSRALRCRRWRGVAHRGAAATDRSGDGAGLLTCSDISCPLFYSFVMLRVAG